MNTACASVVPNNHTHAVSAGVSLLALLLDDQQQQRLHGEQLISRTSDSAIAPLCCVHRANVPQRSKTDDSEQRQTAAGEGRGVACSG